MIASEIPGNIRLLHHVWGDDFNGWPVAGFSSSGRANKARKTIKEGDLIAFYRTKQDVEPETAHLKGRIIAIAQRMKPGIMKETVRLVDPKYHQKEAQKWGIAIMMECIWSFKTPSFLEELCEHCHDPKATFQEPTSFSRGCLPEIPKEIGKELGRLKVEECKDIYQSTELRRILAGHSI